ncbi:MAG: recombination protein RecR [Candidatus Dadabacteria bacterium]|nr:recombination protein RecR [Candidatus Dadabacteria bacterium]
MHEGFPKPVSNLIDLLSQLPGIGEKNATRLAIQILKNSAEYANSLSNALLEVKSKVNLCSRCFCLTADNDCGFCNNEQRANIICVVEDPIDLIAVEKSKEFRGRYHVLHGTISPIEGLGPEDLKIDELIKRIESENTEEIIIATNPSVEGEATALYLSKLIKPLGVKITRIAHGVPMGGDIEYIDELTLGKAIKDRKPI